MNKNYMLSLLFLFSLWSLNAQIAVQRLATINTGSMHNSPTFKLFNGALYFDAGYSIKGNGLEPWKYNFDNHCPYNFIDLHKGVNFTFDSRPIFLTQLNGKILFTATDGISKYGLWQTNGNYGNATKISGTSFDYALNEPSWNSIGPAGQNVDYAIVNNKVIFNAKDSLHGEEVWISDGTTASLLKDVDPGMYNANSPITSFPREFTKVGNKVFFRAFTRLHSHELWVTDGTTSGTYMVKDIYKGNGSNASADPRNFKEINNKLYFTAIDSAHGRELWVSDGTEAGTKMIKDINEGTANAYPTIAIKLNNKLIIVAENGINSSGIYTLDPNTDVLTKINMNGIKYPENFIQHGNNLCFINNYSELWSIDGTSNEATLIKSNMIYAKNLLSFAGKLIYYSEGDLWVTDGTTAVTNKLIQDFEPRSYHIIKNKLFVYGQYYKLILCDSLLNITKIPNPKEVQYYGDIFQKEDAIYFEGSESISIDGPGLYRIGDSIPPCNIFTSVKDISKLNKQFQIFPNPTNSNAFKIITNEQNVYIIFDFNGKIIQNGTIISGENKIELPSSIANGIYFVKIGNTTQKLIVHK